MEMACSECGHVFAKDEKYYSKKEGELLCEFCFYEYAEEGEYDILNIQVDEMTGG